MKKSSLVKILMGVGVLSLGAVATGVQAKSQAVTQVDATDTFVMTPGASMYAFVPPSWVENNRTLKFKFVGSGTKESSSASPSTESFSDTLSVVSGYKYLFTGTIPNYITSGYVASTFTWNKMQVVSYASGATGASFTASTGLTAPTGNEIYVNYTTAFEKATSNYSTKTFDSANPGTAPLNDWAAGFLYALDKTNVCGANLTAPKGTEAGALVVYGAGWGGATPNLNSKFAALSADNQTVFKTATANRSSAVYYERAASLYDYVVWKIKG